MSLETNQGPKTAQELVGDLTFINYAVNRDLSPDISVERWKAVYGPSVYRMESRYQEEKK